MQHHTCKTHVQYHGALTFASLLCLSCVHADGHDVFRLHIHPHIIIVILGHYIECRAYICPVWAAALLILWSIWRPYLPFKEAASVEHLLPACLDFLWNDLVISILWGTSFFVTYIFIKARSMQCWEELDCRPSVASKTFLVYFHSYLVLQNRETSLWPQSPSIRLSLLLLPFICSLF